ncbi:hypothetical protein APSETT445_009214 [Aspergillus pseudonomiae]
MKFSTSLPLFAALAAAQTVIEGSSFGHGYHPPGTPSRDGQLEEKDILLKLVSQSEWSAEFQFRASGVERGGGNLQLWYAKDGQSKIGTSSIYTVGQWDGFALVVDMHGGRRGSIRGFLNDGTTDYKSHRSVDSLAFGHCDYSYRNLGRASVVRVKHTNANLEVTVDDKLCFATDKVSLPAGNTFGVTAATPENPDSFEVFKFVLQTAQSGTAPPAQQQNNQQQQQQQQQQPVAAQAQTQQQPRTDQFVDLAARIELVNKATSNVIREIGNQAKQSENRHLDLQQKLATKEQVAGFDARLQKIEQMLQTIQRDLEGKDYHSRFNQLQDTLRSSHQTLTEHLQGSVLSAITASTPRMGFFICLIIAFQVFLAVSYIVYKRRRANMPKKFL